MYVVVEKFYRVVIIMRQGEMISTTIVLNVEAECSLRDLYNSNVKQVSALFDIKTLEK